MRNRSICLLNDSFPPIIDGVANAVVNYARIIKQNGGTPIVVTPNHPDADDSQFDFDVVRFKSLDTREKVGYMTGLPFSSRALDQLTGKNIDLLHSHCPFTSHLFARSVREIMPAPLVYTYHTKFSIDIKKLVRSRLIQDTAKDFIASNITAADEVWVVSNGAGKDMCDIIGHQINYHVMENGVDLPRERVPEAEMHELLKEYNLPHDVPVFIFVGRMMWYKGIRISLEALEGIHSQGKDFRMVFIGGGADEEEIKRTARELGIYDKCLFCGKIYDRRKLQAWYTRADLMLFPSTFDTNGLVVREAAACSLPSVLVAGSCAAEGTIADQNCFQITESASSMAALLMRIIDNRSFMKQTGENAARELYISWEEAVRRAEDRYEIIIDNFKSGIYKNRRRFSDEFIKMNADFMDIKSSFHEALKTLQNDEDGGLR